MNNPKNSLDLSISGWLVSLKRASEKIDKVAEETKPADLQRTIFFSQRGVQAFMKMRSLVLSNKISEMIIVIRDYSRPSECVVFAQRAKFLLRVQNQEESDDGFLGRLREAARFSNFSELENMLTQKTRRYGNKISRIWSQVGLTLSWDRQKSNWYANCYTV